MGVGLIKSNGTLSRQSNVGAGRAYTVSMMGDSLTVRNQPNADLYNGGSQPSSTQINALYALKQKMFHTTSPLQHGAMRSGGNWAPFEVVFGCSGATSSQILAWLPSIIAGYPYGLPNAMIVLAGTNDAGVSASVSTLINNLTLIYQFLINIGVQPIAATPPPRSDAQASFVTQYAIAIKRLAYKLKIPCVDFYSALASGANGQYASANYTTDNIHWTPLAAGLCGYVLNSVIQSSLNLSPIIVPKYYDNAAFTAYSRDPNFQTITGTINTASSYPTTLGWTAPSPTSMSTVFDSTGTEIGSNHTMFAATPSTILGGNNTPNYIGNAWQLKGNGVNTELFLTGTPVAYTVGNRLAISFRMKWIPDMAAVSKGQFAVGLWDATNGYAAGISEGYITDYGNQTVPIGNETGYVAGDFYQEFTVLSTFATMRPLLALNKRGGGATNSGDSITISNFQIIDLTAAGIA